MNTALAFPLATWVALALGASVTLAHASPPIEKVVCTDAPRTSWMSESQARAIFNAASYPLVRFKVSKGNCHEFYAVAANGDVVEAYLHPVTGAIVRQTRIPHVPSPTASASPSPLSPSPSSASSASSVHGVRP